MSTAPTQTEAQRLADACDAEQVATVKRDILMHDVAALLRRQEALIERQRELLEQASECITQLVACHQEESCPAVSIAKRITTAIRTHREAK